MCSSGGSGREAVVEATQLGRTRFGSRGHELELEDQLSLVECLPTSIFDEVDVKVGRAGESDHQVAQVDKL